MVTFYGTAGMPAIQPGAHVSDPTQAAFTRVEVEQYLARNPGVVSPIPGSSGGVLANVEFITAAEAGARLRPQLNDRSIDRPDDTLICWAEVTGPLDRHISVPPCLRAEAARIPPADRGILILDAQTGNLLLLASA
jgi:hypothetical protein